MQSGSRRWSAHDRRLFAASQVAIAALVIAMAIPAGPVHRAFAGSLATSDFQAFYCAGKLTLERRDPYLAAPLEQCERAAVASVDPGVLVPLDPAPQPAYDFAFMAPFALLPYGPAALLWTALLLAAGVAIARILAILTGLPYLVVVACFAIGAGYQTIPYGQLPPLAIVALCASALLLERDAPRSAALASACAMIEPHVALPACCALFLWVPRARLVLLAAGTLLGALAIALVGPQAALDYFTQVLPVHQISEIGASIQYSFTWLLYVAHAAPDVALRGGSLDYLVMLAFGVALARPAARALRSSAPLVLFPPAVAMLGGPFVHVQEIVAAMPFALFAAARAPNRAGRVLAWSAVALLMVNWPASTQTRVIVLEIACAATVVGFLTNGRAVPVRASIAIGAFLAYEIVSRFIGYLPPPATGLDSNPYEAASRYDPALASTREALDQTGTLAFHDRSARTLASKVPTWLGLALLCVVPLELRRRRPA